MVTFDGCVSGGTISGGNILLDDVALINAVNGFTFNGIIYPTVFDKQKEQKTLSNDGPAASPEKSFMTQTNKVYSGKSSVVNGFFEFSFVVLLQSF